MDTELILRLFSMAALVGIAYWCGYGNGKNSPRKEWEDD